MQEQCSGTNKQGERCRARALPGSDFCISHDPNRVVELAEWRRKGGRAKSNKARIRKQLPDAVLTPAELQGLLSKAIRDVLAGTLEPGPANAAGGLARALVTIQESAELEQRLTELERQAGIERRYPA